MKLKALVAAAALALLGASLALAAPPPGKGNPNSTTTTTNGKKPPKTGVGCRPTVSVILKGTLAADGTAAPSTLSLTVKSGNSLGARYKNVPQPFGVAVTTSTKVTRQGTATSAAALKAHDAVNVQARACKADLAGGKTPALTATRVTVQQ